MATDVVERTRIPAFAGILGESLGEFLGTMVLILFGDGCVAGLWLFGFGTNTPLFINWIIIALGWGLAVMLGVYTAGTLSGAHLNPAVTLAFAATRKFPWNKVIPYWIAQVAGAFVAALILWVVYHGAFMNFETVNHITRGMNDYAGKGMSIGAAKVFNTFKAPFIDVFRGAYFDQVVGTALLVGLIFAIVDTMNAPPQGNVAPLIIGLLVVAIGLSFGYNAGYAINPARDFGPRLLAWVVGFKGIALPGPDNYFWVPIVGPLVGAVAGAFVYEYTIHQALLAKMVGSSGSAVETGTTDRATSDSTTTGRGVREP
ncbi:MAG: MIP/aquaporin family protein [Acidobacteriaceae bacterium]